MKQPEYLAGLLRVLILSELSQGENYGYGIALAVAERSGQELSVRPESLYPVLHRLEQDGLLKARWAEAENGRPRKLYALTSKGRRRWERQRTAFISQTQGALKAIGADAAPETR